MYIYKHKYIIIYIYILLHSYLLFLTDIYVVFLNLLQFNLHTVEYHEIQLKYLSGIEMCFLLNIYIYKYRYI